MRRSGKLLLRVTAAAVILSGTALSVQAGSLLLDHMRLDLSARQPIAEMAVQNTSAEPMLVQSQIFAWTQAGGEDQLTDSEALLVSPPIFEIAPGARQLVRVGLMGAADPQRETSYRVILQQVPRPAEADGVAVFVLLRISFPVFVAPTGASATANLSWRAGRMTGDRIQVTLTNSGNRHVQVTALDLLRVDGTPLASEGAFMAYVLPGQERSWDLDLDAPWVGGQLYALSRSVKRMPVGAVLSRVVAAPADNAFHRKGCAISSTGTRCVSI